MGVSGRGEGQEPGGPLSFLSVPLYKVFPQQRKDGRDRTSLGRTWQSLCLRIMGNFFLPSNQ